MFWTFQMLENYSSLCSPNPGWDLRVATGKLVLMWDWAKSLEEPQRRYMGTKNGLHVSRDLGFLQLGSSSDLFPKDLLPNTFMWIQMFTQMVLCSELWRVEGSSLWLPSFIWFILSAWFLCPKRWISDIQDALSTTCGRLKLEGNNQGWFSFFSVSSSFVCFCCFFAPI